jgi:hypothetical protein
MEASTQRVYREQQQHQEEVCYSQQPQFAQTSITYNLPPFPNIIKEVF